MSDAIGEDVYEQLRTVIPEIKRAVEYAFEVIIMKLKDAADCFSSAVAGFGRTLYHMLMPVKHSVIVSCQDVGATTSLIRRYTIFKRRVRVKSRVCDGSTNKGQYKLTFYMTNAQYASLMTKLRIRKFDCRMAIGRRV